MHFYYCCKKCKKRLSFATAAAVAVFVTPTGFEAGPMRKKQKLQILLKTEVNIYT